MLRLVFFSVWILFHEHSRITGQQRRGMLFILTTLYIFYPFHRHLDISLAITTDSCPRHIASCRTRAGSHLFPSANCTFWIQRVTQDNIHFMHDAETWPNILSKYFLKSIWPFFLTLYMKGIYTALTIIMT